MKETNEGILGDDELEEIAAEEVKHKKTLETLKDIKKRYKSLFGSDPDDQLPIAEIQDKIRVEMIRRDLRPFRL